MLSRMKASTQLDACGACVKVGAGVLRHCKVRTVKRVVVWCGMLHHGVVNCAVLCCGVLNCDAVRCGKLNV